jgi:hypothetical protein
MAEVVSITVIRGYLSPQPLSLVWHYGRSLLTLRGCSFRIRLRACAGGVLDELSCGIMAVCVIRTL